MFDELFNQPFVVGRYQNAPHAESRANFGHVGEEALDGCLKERFGEESDTRPQKLPRTQRARSDIVFALAKRGFAP